MHGEHMAVGDIRTDFGTGNIYQDGGNVASLSAFWVRLGIGNSAVASYTLAGGTLSPAAAASTWPKTVGAR